MEIAWFGDPESLDATRVGGKAASLGRLASEYRVPPAFSVTTEVFDRWAADCPGGEELTVARLPGGMAGTLASAYAELADRVGLQETPVAVRSSAIDEDGTGASFAGQHDTFLNVVGPEAVALAVARCWASLRSNTALEYRRRNNLEIDTAQMGVFVQFMVRADVAGVAFSANPVTGNRDEVVVNASWGLGESIVGGTVTPDMYTVRKSDLALLSSDIADKARMTVYIAGGTREVDVPRIMRSQPSLSEEQAREVARLAADLERSTGQPVDIEWAVREKTLYLLQCRPITTLR